MNYKLAILQQTEAIINATNGSLLGRGGVDGSIHRVELLKAGKQIRKNELHGAYLQASKVMITKGYRLHANSVLHTVGPIW